MTKTKKFFFFYWGNWLSKVLVSGFPGVAFTSGVWFFPGFCGSPRKNSRSPKRQHVFCRFATLSYLNRPEVLCDLERRHLAAGVKDSAGMSQFPS